MIWRSVAWSLLVALLVGWMGGKVPAVEKRSLSPPVYLPDGQEFKTWEVPLTFSRTYYVDASHPQASDDNPGSESRPFRTINRAARVLRPGERVVIAAGTHRERVRPARGGTGPDQMISYEAKPGETVVIKGSRTVNTKWAPSGRSSQTGTPRLWTTTLPKELFAEENPFGQLNLADAQIDKCMPWAVSTKGKVPNTLRRGLVFQDGKRLSQVAAFEQLSGAAGTYWVEADGLTLHVRPLGDADPNQARFEVTAQGFIFAPEEYGLGYIRVMGLTIEQAGNCFPRPQQGALSTMRGHHWIIEDNTVQECNSIGIDIGDQFDISGPELAQGGEHIVRGNTVTDCGIGGIEGKSIEHTLIEENTVRRCGWHRIWRIYEVAGIKVHCTVSSLLRRNLVADTFDAPGIWMDYANVNSRCTGNVVFNVQSEVGGIFMEASQVPNLVDTNFLWNCRQNGIYQHDCDELVIAHNFIAQSPGAAIRMRICQGRRVGGRLSTAKRNKIVGNLFVDNGSMLSISDPDNVSDYNVFAGSREPFNLTDWQKAHGWDKGSVTAEIQAAFDPDAFGLTWSCGGKIPECPPVSGITHDFFDKPRSGPTVAPGPFLAIPAQPAQIRVDPRRSQRASD